MWNKQSVADKRELMLNYKKAHPEFSYNDMVKDYNDSYQKFGNGGEKSETVNQPKFQDPFEKAKYLNNSAIQEKEDQRIKDMGTVSSLRQMPPAPFTREDLQDGIKYGVNIAGVFNPYANVASSVIDLKDEDYTGAALGAVPYVGKWLKGYAPGRRVLTSLFNAGVPFKAAEAINKTIRGGIKVGVGAGKLAGAKNDFYDPLVEREERLTKHRYGGIQAFADGGEKGFNNENPLTFTDSAMIYNNSLQKNAFYANNKDYTEVNEGTGMGDWNKAINNVEHTKDSFAYNKKTGNYRFPAGLGERFKMSDDEYQKELNIRNTNPSKNIVSVPDLGKSRPGASEIYYGSDALFNPSSPPNYYSKYIKPDSEKTYISTPESNYGDRSTVAFYDPLKVKPYSMLTEDEKIARVEKYGTAGFPANYKPKPKNVIRQTGPVRYKTVEHNTGRIHYWTRDASGNELPVPNKDVYDKYFSKYPEVPYTDVRQGKEGYYK